MNIVLKFSLLVSLVIIVGGCNENINLCEQGNSCEADNKLSLPKFTGQSLLVNGSIDSLALTVSGNSGSSSCSDSFSVTSSNPVLIDISNITFSGIVPNCTISLSPKQNQTGSATVSIKLNVGDEEVSADLNLTVNPPPGPPNLTPGEEWIEVPANAGGMGLDSFFVMKYEAKAMLNDESASSATGTDATPATHKPVSTADNQPWRNINANDAAAECESLGSGYHLISNQEWMAIAREIENQDANWTDGSVGQGCLFSGNIAHQDCGYNAAITPDSGFSRNMRASHRLSNGLEIFDISGNVNEWVDWDRDNVGFQKGPTSCALSYIGLPSVSCGSLFDVDFNTSNGLFTRDQGVGEFLGGAGGAALRGGHWTTILFFQMGVFNLDLSQSPSYSGSLTGFRCVYRL